MRPSHPFLRTIPLLIGIGIVIVGCFLSPAICDSALGKIADAGYPDPSCVIHYCCFLALAFSVNLALPPTRRKGIGATLLVSLGVFAFSAMLEYLQPLAGRTTEAVDLLANGLGVATFFILYRLFRRREVAVPSDYSIARQAVAAYRSRHHRP